MTKNFISVFAFLLMVFICLQACTSVKDRSIVNKDRNRQGSKVNNLNKPPHDRKVQTTQTEGYDHDQPGLQTQNGSLKASNKTLTSSYKKLLEPLETKLNTGAVTLDSRSKSESTSQNSKIDTSSPLPDLQLQFDIRETETMWDFYNYYTRKRCKIFQRWLKRAEKYLPYIRKVFREQGLPDDLVFLPLAESGFNPWAYSRAGAAGLWQFMPATGRHYGLKVNWWIDERRDPYKSTKAAAKYLKKLYAQFDDWYLALAAYNAGEGTVCRALKRSGTDNYFDLKDKEHYLKQETQKYVPKLFAILKIIRNKEKFNFESIDWKASAKPIFIYLPGGTDLKALSKVINMDWSKFKTLNPVFRRSVTPPEQRMKIFLPRAKVKEARNYLQSHRVRRYAGCLRYKIKYGDSWWKLSRQFDIPIGMLKSFNNISSNMLRPGQSVLIPKSRSHIATGESQGQAYNHEYRVKAGDSLWSIASRFDISLKELRQKNNFYRDAKTLQKGQKIIIPGRGNRQSVRELAKQRANYRIQKGDTLWDISKRFGVSLQTLLQANGISKNERLDIGMKLYVPDISYSASQLAKKRAGLSHDKIVKYRVRKGDNVWNIARKFGVDTHQLMSWNDLSKDEYIHPGEELKIYID